MFAILAIILLAIACAVFGIVPALIAWLVVGALSAAANQAGPIPAPLGIAALMVFGGFWSAVHTLRGM